MALIVILAGCHLLRLHSKVGRHSKTCLAHPSRRSNWTDR